VAMPDLSGTPLRPARPTLTQIFPRGDSFKNATRHGSYNLLILS
jgi:hypothetical protein